MDKWGCAPRSARRSNKTSPGSRQQVQLRCKVERGRVVSLQYLAPPYCNGQLDTRYMFWQECQGPSFDVVNLQEAGMLRTIVQAAKRKGRSNHEVQIRCTYVEPEYGYAKVLEFSGLVPQSENLQEDRIPSVEVQGQGTDSPQGRSPKVRAVTKKIPTPKGSHEALVSKPSSSRTGGVFG